MSVDRAVFFFAGCVTLPCAIPAWPWRRLLTGFVGANMIQASFTGFCPAARIAKTFGAGAGSVFK